MGRHRRSRGRESILSVVSSQDALDPDTRDSDDENAVVSIQPRLRQRHVRSSDTEVRTKIAR
jgi:hypothetical protein